MQDYTDRRNRRIETLLREEIARILSARRDPDIGFITVTRVKMKKDRSKVFCYVRFLSDEEKGFSALKEAKSSIKAEIARSISLRFMPDIEFRIDEEGYPNFLS
jgi:ribosome-binding factor A